MADDALERPPERDSPALGRARAAPADLTYGDLVRLLSELAAYVGEAPARAAGVEGGVALRKEALEALEAAEAFLRERDTGRGSGLSPKEFATVPRTSATGGRSSGSSRPKRPGSTLARR